LGYTHQHHQKKAITKAAWKLIRADVEKLLANLPATGDAVVHEGLPLALGDGMGTPGSSPIVDDDAIVFNGIQPHDYEGFYLSRPIEIVHAYQKTDLEKDGFVYTFTKTEYMPYDLVVCGVLLILNKHAPAARTVESDGGPKEWMPVWRWVRSVLGSGYDLPKSFYDEARSPKSYWQSELAKLSIGDPACARWRGYIDRREEELLAYEVERDSWGSPTLAHARIDLSPTLGGIAC
jgi:hypothetical protein